ncbi:MULTISPECIES: hypothetical protein [Nocardiaceae]|uniref:hypothetical protein n=1 Tax=Nocardiaceae TaxID=85025 RepID=UPI000AB3FF08|nr:MULTISPECIES: hypothetical protein [Rhodococcus]
MTAHTHTWTTESSHNTSEGTVTYQRCTCGSQRIRAPKPAAATSVAVVEAR